MSVLHFRILVVVIMLFSAFGGFIDLINPMAVVEDISSYADNLQPEMDKNSWIVFIIIAILTSICALGSFVGLLLLKPWGRTLYLCGFIVALPAYYYSGVSVISPAAQVLCDIGAYGQGFILALCYFSPLNIHFKRLKGAKPFVF